MSAGCKYPAHFPIDLIPADSNKRRILEIGCGAGFDAERFSEMGFDYCGLDLSPDAVWLTKQRLRRTCLPGRVSHVDFMLFDPKDRFDCIFDRGVFHNQKLKKRRKCFAKMVYKHLSSNGVWISISGSAENSHDPNSHGCLSLDEILDGVTGKFRLEDVSLRLYGPKNWPQNFEAWYCVFKPIPSSQFNLPYRSSK